ncbi:MAG: hypothetical protein ACYCY6_03185 [Minisyncoccota bacterium]
MMKKYIVSAFFVLLGVYAIFQGRFIILGPRVSIDSPVGDTLHDTGIIEVTGVARNVSYISLNDRQIHIDRTGRFVEKVVIASGINIIKVALKDRFGRQREELVRVVGS